MEGAVAGAIAHVLARAGLPGNVRVRLVATQGNVSVINPTAPVEIAVQPIFPPEPI